MEEQSGTSMPLRLAILALRAVRWAIFLVVVLFLITPMILDALGARKGDAGTNFLYAGRTQILTAVGPQIRSVLPTKFQGKDRTDWVLLFALVLLGALLGAIKNNILTVLYRRKMRAEASKWKSEMHLPAQSPLAAAFDAKVKTLEAGKTIDRQELLSIFAETKRKLDALARDLTFLSVDVVGSTQMKESEEPASIQHDFHEYRKLVERIFQNRKVVKATWTPDGVMACFDSIDDAVNAGKDLITELVDFNRKTKLMRKDFVVRCGVNSGRVYFDDTTPLETISDRAIDVAGHMQKYADPNTIAISRSIVEPLRSGEGFAPAERVVDGYEVYSWTPTAR